MRLAALAMALLLSVACKKKEKQEPDTLEPPPPGGASLDTLATLIGDARGLEGSLAPTSTKWERVFTLGDETVILVGRALDTAIAIRSTDSGRTWTALKTGAQPWSSWSIAEDGSVLLATGKRAAVKVPAGVAAPIGQVELWFGTADAQKLRGPSVLFPNDGALKEATIPTGAALPIAWPGEIGALVVDRRRTPLVAYGAAPGEAQPEPMTLPRGSFVRSPYGRPAQLLTVSRNGLEVQPWPKPGETLAATGAPVPGFRSFSDAVDQLSAGPSCEANDWSFHRIAASPDKPQLIGVSGSRALALDLPPRSQPNLGCSVEAVVVETPFPDRDRDGKPDKELPWLVRCSLEGQCVDAKNPPFEVWPEKHTREIRSVATAQGLVAVMTSRAGTRWGLYLGTSVDGGTQFELPRAIGEGATDLGYYELGAIVTLPKRVLLLISADVTGTTRRGWYLLATDDAGSHWGPP